MALFHLVMSQFFQEGSEHLPHSCPPSQVSQEVGAGRVWFVSVTCQVALLGFEAVKLGLANVGIIF